jgi:hypothetical protein
MEAGRAERDAVLRRQIQVMSPERFEQLVFELARRDDPEVRRLVHPDGGADTLRPAIEGRRSEVWQAKRYPAGINWDECEGSLDQSVKHWDPQRITFAFARDFSATVEKSFQSRLVQRQSAQDNGVTVTAWTLSELARRLDDHPDIKVRFFGDEQEDVTAGVVRAIQAGGKLETGSDLVERATTLSEFAEQQDVDFTYQVVSGSPTTPAPGWQDLPYLVMEMGDERVRVQVATWVREGAEVDPPNVWFADDEPGQSARMQAVRALARGEVAEVTSGLRMQLRAPQVMRDLMPQPSEMSGTAKLHPGDPTKLELELRTAEGTVVRELQMRPVPPPPGTAAAFAGYSGSVLVEASFTLHEEPTISANITCSAHFGPNAAENAPAAELMYAFFTHSKFTLRSRAFFPDAGEISGASDELRQHPQLADMEWMRRFYADVAYLERALGIALPIPAELTALNLDEVGTAANVLRTGEGSATFHQTQGFVQNPAEIPRLPERFRTQGSVRKMVSYAVFGQELQLGLGEYELPPLKVVDIIPHGQTPDAPARVVLEAEGNAQMRFRLVDGAVADPAEPVPASDNR